MRTVAGRVLLLGVALWVVAAQPPGLAYVADAARYAPINYDTFRPPAAGETSIDPAFGTAVTRISDARNTLDAARSGVLTVIGNEYSTMTPFNADNSRLLLHHQSYFALYDGEGHYLRDLPLEITAASEARWSRHDPNLLYYVSGNRLKQYDAASGVVGTIHTFTEYAVVNGRGESDICFDGGHLVLVGDYQDIFVYDIAADVKGPVLTTPVPGDVDNVHITAGDNVLVSWYAGGEGRYRGVELFDRSMNFLRQVSRILGHMDVTRDANGEEVLLFANSGDPNPLPGCVNAIVKIALADARQTCVIAFDWGLGVHVSGSDDSGWVTVSTYAPADPNPLQWWAPYANEILQVRLDGSQVRRLAHHRSRPFNTYGWTPRASASRDGTKVVFSSNYGLSTVLGYPLDYSDAYLIDLASASPAVAGSQARLGVRVEQDAATSSGTWYSNTLPFHSGGSALLTMEPGARVSFTFTGTGVRWIGYRDEWSGIASVYVDGVLDTVADTFAAASERQAVLFAKTGLAMGTHTLLIEAAGAGHPLARGAWVWVDAFEVVTRFEQDDPAVQQDCPLGAGWYTNLLGLHSGGTALLGMAPVCRTTFSFTGTAVSWIGYRDNWSGIARVWVDGVFRADVDTYASPAQAQTVMYTLTGLPRAAHSLTIAPAGRWHPSSVGTWIWIDAFEIVP